MGSVGKLVDAKIDDLRKLWDETKFYLDCRKERDRILLAMDKARDAVMVLMDKLNKNKIPFPDVVANRYPVTKIEWDALALARYVRQHVGPESAKQILKIGVDEKVVEKMLKEGSLELEAVKKFAISIDRSFRFNPSTVEKD